MKNIIAGTVALMMILSACEKKVEPVEKIITIRINKEEMKKHADKLKNIFAKYPGEYVLYMQVNGSTVRTQTKIDANLELKKALDQLLGEDRISVH